MPSWRRWLLVLAAVYVVLPFDAIPDVIPFIGWLDDLGVVAAAFAFLSRDVARHEEVNRPMPMGRMTSES